MQTEMQIETRRRRRWLVGYIPPRPEPKPRDDGDEILDVALPLTPVEATHLGAWEEWVAARVVERGADGVLTAQLIDAPHAASIAREGDKIEAHRSPRGWLMLSVVERAPTWETKFLKAHPELIACVVCGQPGTVEPGRWWEARCEDHPPEDVAEEGEEAW